MRTRTMRFPTLVLAILATLGACEPRAGQEGEAAATEGEAALAEGGAAAVDTAAILGSVDSLRAAYQEAVAAGDWQRLSTMVVGDAIIVGPGTAAWDSLRAASEGPFPEGAALEISPMETRPLGDDWVYEMGTGTVTWTPAGAGEARTLRDTYLVLLRRTTEGWKVYREVSSAAPLPAEANSGEAASARVP